MNSPELIQRLLLLRSQHPGAHPFTLSLLLQVETGVVLTGQQATELLRKADQALH